MWILEITGQRKKIGNRDIFVKLASTYNLVLRGYPISSKILTEKVITTFIGSIEGSQNNIDKVTEEIKKIEIIRNFEISENLYIFDKVETLEGFKAFKSNIFYLEPITFYPNNKIEWKVGSFDKDNLNKFLTYISENYEIIINSLKKKKINNFNLNFTNPNLTLKQKEILEYSQKEGLYDIPRKTSVQKIAKNLGLSFSTTQAHLKKTESKIINFFIKYIK
jgi:predicted DNA binding protein